MRERVSSDPFSSRTCRVALLGFGTVGSAVARRLAAPDASAPVLLTHIFDRRAAEKRASLPDPPIASGFNGANVASGVSGANVASGVGRTNVASAVSGTNVASGFSRTNAIVWTDRIEDILHGDVDVVVEAIGGVEPAAGWIHALLAAGKSVVTANKQVMARDGAALLGFAARQGRQLRFEAAVGGAMPIVRAIADGLAGDRIVRIVGILNGTTNAVLTRMEETGCGLADAVCDARTRGYAEADPSSDLSGDDARAKLAILCALAFGLRVNPAAIGARSAAAISASDVTVARRRGKAIRQIAHAEFDRAGSALTAWVAPIEVPQHSLFGQAAGPQNAAIVTGEHSGDTGIFGTGAGGDATAVAILSDLAAIARDRAAVVPAPLLTTDFVVRAADDAERFYSHVDRMEVAC